MTQTPGWSAPDDDQPDRPVPAEPPHPGNPPEYQPGHQPEYRPPSGSPDAGGWGQPGYGQPAPGGPSWSGPPAGSGPPPYGGGPNWAPPPRPGIIPLRPIGLGEIYDGAFQAIRTNPRTMIGISAIVIAATTLITTVPQAAALSGIDDSGVFRPGATPTARELAGPLASLFSAVFVPALVQSLAVTVVTGLLIVAVSGAVLGRRTPPGVLWARTRRRIPGLIGIAVLTLLVPALISTVLAAPGIVVLAAGSQGLGAALIVLGVLASVPIAVLVYVRWSMAAPAMLLEEQPLATSLRRSWRLVTGSTWRVLGILLLTAIMVGVLAGIISVPFTLLGSVSTAVGSGGEATGFGAALTQLLFSGIGQIIAGAVLYPFTAAVTALLYIDLRMRREGLDVELIRACDAGSPA